MKEPTTTPFKKGGNAQEVPNTLRGGEEILSKAMMEKMKADAIKSMHDELERRKSCGHIKADGFSFEQLQDLLNR